MNYGIQRLCHLVQVKNDLNRRRRRFYEIANPRHGNSSNRNSTRKVCKAFSKEFAYSMYENTKQDMKAMTKDMRALRVEMGAQFVWSDHGAISFLKCGETTYSPKQIAKLAELYHADGILLGD